MAYLIATARKTNPEVGSLNTANLSLPHGQPVPLQLELNRSRDSRFVCRDCGAKHVWSANEQQWWYDTPNGYVYSTRLGCLSCQRGRRLAHAGQ